MVDYFLNDGYEEDAWGPKENSAWSEQNATAQGGNSIGQFLA